MISDHAGSRERLRPGRRTELHQRKIAAIWRALADRTAAEVIELWADHPETAASVPVRHEPPALIRTCLE